LRTLKRDFSCGLHFASLAKNHLNGRTKLSSRQAEVAESEQAVVSVFAVERVIRPVAMKAAGGIPK
jgi:hypothetical protein